MLFFDRLAPDATSRHAHIMVPNGASDFMGLGERASLRSFPQAGRELQSQLKCLWKSGKRDHGDSDLSCAKSRLDECPFLTLHGARCKAVDRKAYTVGVAVRRTYLCECREVSTVRNACRGNCSLALSSASVRVLVIPPIPSTHSPPTAGDRCPARPNRYLPASNTTPRRSMGDYSIRARRRRMRSSGGRHPCRRNSVIHFHSPHDHSHPVARFSSSQIALQSKRDFNW